MSYHGHSVSKVAYAMEPSPGPPLRPSKALTKTSKSPVIDRRKLAKLEDGGAKLDSANDKDDAIEAAWRSEELATGWGGKAGTSGTASKRSASFATNVRMRSSVVSGDGQGGLLVPGTLVALERGETDSSFSFSRDEAEEEERRAAGGAQEERRLAQEARRMRILSKVSNSSSDRAEPEVREDGDAADKKYDHLTASIGADFQQQMLQLLSANEKLTTQVSGLESNRGVKIDQEQFEIWKLKLEALQLEIDEGKVRAALLEAESAKRLETIKHLEEELQLLRTDKEELLEEISDERAKGLGGGPVATMGVKQAPKRVACQTRHSGVIPDKPKLTVMTSISTQSEGAKTFVAVDTQTEAPPLSPRVKRVPPPEAGEMDNLMIMGELDEIRKILESNSGDTTTSLAWNEVCSHGVMSALSAVKQRAKVFRSELDISRRQMKKRDSDASVVRKAIEKREGGGGGGGGASRSSGEDVEYASAPARLMQMEQMGGGGQGGSMGGGARGGGGRGKGGGSFRLQRRSLPAVPISPNQKPSQGDLLRSMLQQQRNSLPSGGGGGGGGEGAQVMGGGFSSPIKNPKQPEPRAPMLGRGGGGGGGSVRYSVKGGFANG